MEREGNTEAEARLQLERETAVAAVQSCERPEELGALLWRVVELYAGEPFLPASSFPLPIRLREGSFSATGRKSRSRRLR